MNQAIRLLRNIGMMFLYVFFFSYAIGKASFIGKYYLYFIYLSIVIALLIFILNPQCLLKYKQYYIWMSAFMIFQACTLVYTFDFFKGVEWFISSIKVLLKITAVAIICDNNEGFLKLCKGLTFIGGLEFITLKYTGRLYENWRLGAELLGNANSFALIIMFFSIGTLISIFNEERLMLKCVYMVFLIGDVYMQFLSGGRKFILFELVFIYSSLILRSGRINILNIILSTFVVAGIVLIGYLLIMNVTVLYDHIGIRLIGLGSEEGAMGVDSQSELMRRGIEMFLKKPILGWGIAGYQRYNGVYYGRFGYSHSNYVELLADYGIIGTLLYYFQYIFCFRYLLLHYDNKCRGLYLPLLLGIIVIDMFALTFNQTAFIPLLLMIISGVAYEEMVHENGGIYFITLPKSKYIRS